MDGSLGFIYFFEKWLALPKMQKPFSLERVAPECACEELLAL
jgi:hypothetical protein